MKKRTHLRDIFDTSIRNQRKIEKIKEQDARTQQYIKKKKAEVEKERLEKEIIQAMKDKDFATAIYLDKKIKESFDNDK